MSETGQANGVDWSASHLLLDNGKTDELLLPIKATERIKYTCVALSKRFVAFGATSGGLYIFQRDSHKYIQVIVNKEGPVSHVAFAPDDNLVGLSTNNGFVVIWQLNVANRKKPELLITSFAHKGSGITCLQWNDTSQKLYSGDSKGKVTVTNAFSRKVSGLLQLPTAPIVSLESAIVQLDFVKDYLLVSSHNKCHICNIKRQQFYSVGRKLRDGLYGACFYMKSKEVEDIVIYSARPGSRLWEANLKGEVVATHQFKRQLAIPDLPLINVQEDERFIAAVDNQPPQALNFPCLLKVDQFIMSWNEKAIYILDTSTGKVVLWSRPPSGIQDLCVYKSDIYFIDNQNRISKLSFLTIERCIVRLFIKQSWKMCASICHQFAETLTSAKARRLISVNFLKDVKQHLTTLEKTEDMIGSLDDVIYRLEQIITEESGASSRRSSIESADSVRLESGIYLIRSRRGSEEVLEGLLSSQVNHLNGCPQLEYEEEHASTNCPAPEHVESIGNDNEHGNKLSTSNEFAEECVEDVSNQDENVDPSIKLSNCQSNELNCDGNNVEQESPEEQFERVYPASNESELQTTLTSNVVNEGQLQEDAIECERIECKDSRLHLEITADCEETVISPNNGGDCVDVLTTKDFRHDGIELQSPELAKNHNTLIESKTDGNDEFSVTTEQQYNDAATECNDDQSSDTTFQTTPVVVLTPSSDSAIPDNELIVDCNELEEGESFVEGAYEPVVRRTESFTCSSSNESRTLVRRSHSVSNSSMDMGSSSPKPLRKQRHRNGRKKKTKSRVPEIGEVKPKKDKLLENKDIGHSLDDHILKSRPKNLNISDKSPMIGRSTSPLFEKILGLESPISSRRGVSPSPVDEVTSERRGQRQISMPFAAVKDSLTSTYSKTKEFVKATKAKLDHNKKSPVTVEDEVISPEAIHPKVMSEDILVKACETSIIYSTFEEATISTRLKLKHPLILYDIGMCHEVLEQWLADLQTACENNPQSHPQMTNVDDGNKATEERNELEDGQLTECNKTDDNMNLEIENEPGVCESGETSRMSLPLRDALHDHAAELLTMCFEIQVFPVSRQPDVDQSNDSLLTNRRLSFSSETLDDVSKQSVASNNGSFVRDAMDDDTSKQLLEASNDTLVLPSESLNSAIDSELLNTQAASFVREFFHFLDVDRMRDVMASWTGCRQKTYSEICNRLIGYFVGNQETSCKNSSCAERVMQIQKQYKDVHRMLRLLIDSPDLIVESLADSKLDLRIWEIKELLQIYQPERAQRLFADYISVIIQQENLSEGCNYIAELCDDTGVFDYLVDSIFKCNVTTTQLAICTCNSPRSGSHTLVWQYQTVLDQLLVSMTTPKMAEICKQYGYWQGCLKLSEHLPRETILHIMWCLGDINILKRKGLTPNSFDEWHCILNHISRLEEFSDGENVDGTSIRCQQCFATTKTSPLQSGITNHERDLNDSDWLNTITWENTVQLLAKSIGPQTAIDLLGKFEIPKNRISPEFFHNCIMGIIIDRNQRLLTHAMLEKVDSYLWSKRQNALPQQLKQFVKEEHRCQLSGTTQPKEPAFKGTLSGRQHFLEEPLSHWGVNVCLNKDCLVCGLQVAVQVSESTPGLLVFPCGHIFHSECIPEKFCMVCFYSKKK